MSDRDQAIATHNNARHDANETHGNIRADLTWDDNLANDAANWAQHLASIDDLEHSSNESRPNEGENISSYGGTFAKASLNVGAVQWANEKAKYNGERIGEGNVEDWGHYTQMIWPSTTSFGMAVAQAASGTFYVVARYSPPGNGQGQSAWGNGSHPPPPATGGDGVYLVNSSNGSKRSSGIAYYSHINSSNIGRQPDAYTDIKTDGNVIWEGNIQTGTFKDGNKVVSNIDADAFSKSVGTAVGTAHNNFHGWTARKDDNKVLYTIDGWEVRTIYACA